jgi:hypothetical protein
MNRRQFTTGLAAIAAAPAMPAKALASLPAASAAIPHPARFWAIYMSHLHGTCSPQALSKMTGIDPGVAQGYLSRLVSDGVLTPTNIVSKALSAQTKPIRQQSKLRERLNKFLEDKPVANDAPTVEPELEDAAPDEETDLS